MTILKLQRLVVYNLVITKIEKIKINTAAGSKRKEKNLFLTRTRNIFKSHIDFALIGKGFIKISV